jgi:hypothetical protein
MATYSGKSLTMGVCKYVNRNADLKRFHKTRFAGKELQSEKKMA